MIHDGRLFWLALKDAKEFGVSHSRISEILRISEEVMSWICAAMFSAVGFRSIV